MARYLTVAALGLAGLLAGGGCAQIIGIEDRYTCDEGQALCGSECVNTRNDRRHCGRCDNPCPAGGSCSNGTCGGGPVDAGRDAPAQDASVADGPRPDGPRDAGPPDTGGCQWVDKDCSKEFLGCSIPGDCAGLECVDTPLWGKKCLRPCGCDAQCPFDMFCLPTAQTAYASGFSTYASMGGHCLYSLCGAAPGKAWNNGALRGGCAAGGEGYLKPGVVTTRPGTCMPIDDVDNFGLCFAGGTVPRGGTCTFTDACVKRADYLACEPANYCLGSSGATTGTCTKTCDPTRPGLDPSVAGGDCALDDHVTHDQYCFDRSSYERQTATSIRPARDGWCVDSKGCDVLAATDECSGTGRACEVLNPVSSFGVCEGTIGAATELGACSSTTACANGLYCDIPSGTAGTCKLYCSRGTPSFPKACPGGKWCAPVFYTPDPTPGSDVTDDQTALNWGGCVTIPDGGVPDGA